MKHNAIARITLVLATVSLLSVSLASAAIVKMTNGRTIIGTPLIITNGLLRLRANHGTTSWLRLSHVSSVDFQAQPDKQTASPRVPSVRPKYALEKVGYSAPSDQEARSEKSARTSESPSSQPSSSTKATALEMMEVVFEGKYSREKISSKMSTLLPLYGKDTSDDTMQRAGSALVALRKEFGVQEMRIADRMIEYANNAATRKLVDTFEKAAAMAVAELKAESQTK